VQNEILAKNPSADLRVYAIWLPFVGGYRGAISASVFPDPRVSNYWDGGQLTSNWFSRYLTHRPPPLYDFYALYGPGARWTGALPQPLVGAGETIIGNTSALAGAIHPYLETSGR
jgi:hypothetical protein